MSTTYYSLQYTGNKVIQWKNFTDTSTPLSAANLQKSHTAINDIDQAVNAGFQAMDNAKLDKELAGSMISGIEYNSVTGTFVFHHYDNTIPDLVINTNLEKIVTNWTYNQSTQKLELTQSDGTVVEVDLSAFIANPDLVDSDEIAWTVNAQGAISASIIDGSITDAKIESGFLANCTQQADNAAASSETAAYRALLAKSYANGTSNLEDRPSESVDNASYYNRQARTQKEDAEAWAIGKKNGTDVDSTADQYNNNAKYWSEQARQVAVDMTGATANDDGTHGLVKQPLAGDQNKFFRGDGTWADVPDPQTMTGATASTNGTGGLLPRPLAGDQDKFFKGDGTWATIPQTSGSIADTETSPATSAHPVKDQFFYNDTLYTVISPIAVGEALVEGTNIEESAKIVDQLGQQKGHIIKNSSGTSMADRTALQFENGYIEDDSVNDKTIVKSTNFVGTQAQWNALTAGEQAKYTSKDIIDDVTYDSDLFKIINGKLCIAHYVVTE